MVSFLARVDAVPAARHWVTEVAAGAGVSARTVADIALAVSEAVTNAVVHAFPDRSPGTVQLEVRVLCGVVEVDVSDDGVGMRVRDDIPGAGYGRHLMAAVADDMTEQPTPGGGTHVRLRFRRA